MEPEKQPKKVMRIKWETATKEELAKLDHLTELVGLVRFRVSAYLKTPSEASDSHAFAEEVRTLSHAIENWVDDYEAREVKK